MAVEKISENEKLTEDELEEVADGNDFDSIRDAIKLRDTGKYKWECGFDFGELTDIIQNLGKDIGVNLNIRYERYERGDGPRNRYFIGKREFTRDEFWAFIDNLYAGK